MRDETRERLVPRAVEQPSALIISASREDLRLAVERPLLAIGTVEWVEVREVLLRTWLLNLPRRVPQHRIETGTFRGKHIRELQLPVKELEIAGQLVRNQSRIGGRRSTPR